MKKLIYIFILSIFFISCEKEKIEIVNDTKIVNEGASTRSGGSEDDGTDLGGIIDEDEEEDINFEKPQTHK